MKLGILTQPLHANYGGLLQAYALQTVLTRLGHDVEILNREYVVCKPAAKSMKQRIKSFIKDTLCFFTGQRIYRPIPEDKIAYIRQNSNRFIQKYHHKSPDFFTTQELKTYAESKGFDGYVVGSDQVWRPCNSPQITNYFLDFVSEEPVKRIAYAASFGVDYWEYNEKDTFACAQLVKQFDAVSVREDSGIDLCRKYFDIKARHVLDPTLLLESIDYMRLAEIEKEPQSEGDLFCYVLDNTRAKADLINEIGCKYSLKPYYCNYKGPELHYAIGHLADSIYPPVTKWIRSFMDAKMVIVDSFHGAVFSIIFNKPFWIIANPKRGNARFISLLKIFGLENRLINIEDKSSVDWTASIDWEKVNEIKKHWQQLSLDFLNDHLK